MHPEDIKAELRKRHGTLTAFEKAKELPRLSVSDVLKGRRRRRVAVTIARELNMDLDLVFPGLSKRPCWGESRNKDNNRKVAARHRLKSPTELTGAV